MFETDDENSWKQFIFIDEYVFIRDFNLSVGKIKQCYRR